MTIETKEYTDLYGNTWEIVYIYDGNGGVTQIEKSIYDEQQAALSTPNV